MIGMAFSTPLPIVIVGAGITGLSAATGLVQGGQTPVIFDKGRGVGGRVATRRVLLADGSEAQFDHGAQFATAKGAGFAATLAALQTLGLAAVWNTGDGRNQIIGAPAMSALARGIAQAAKVLIVQNAVVTSVRQDGALWIITFADGSTVQAQRVVLTLPAPQVFALLGSDHGTKSVQMQPCLTLMAAARAPAPFVAARDNSNDLAWIAHDNSKSGRVPMDLTTWVAQANLPFSLLHLEKSADELCALMLPLLCARLGMTAKDIVFSTAHRWRYARADLPLGEAFLHPKAAGLYIGGDWCLGARVEAAWDSGAAIAADILARG